MNRRKILVYEKSFQHALTLRDILEKEGFEVRTVFSRAEAEAVVEEKYDLAIVSSTEPEMITYLSSMKIIVSLSVESKLNTAYPSITLPYTRKELLASIVNVLPDIPLPEPSGDEALIGEDEIPEIAGSSYEIKSFKENLKVVARTNSTVLLLGETGTGKELASSAIHRLSGRKEGPFIAVNCAALAEGLLESELFGHERGAFTGAVKRHPGKFESADGGTLFLDEVGDMPQSLQLKLLRVLENGSFSRVGGEVPLKADVRVICATNRDIFAMAEKGDFRRDLLYRINVIALKLPPLRERRKDIPILAEKFLDNYSKKYKRRIDKFSDKVLSEMEEYPWPGNVRELLHSIEHAVAKTKGGVVEKIEFGGEKLMAKWNPPTVDELLDYDLSEMKTEVLERYEKEYLDRILLQEGGSLNRASRRCGIDRKTLYRKMLQYGLDKKDYR